MLFRDLAVNIVMPSKCVTWVILWGTLHYLTRNLS